TAALRRPRPDLRASQPPALRRASDDLLGGAARACSDPGPIQAALLPLPARWRCLHARELRRGAVGPRLRSRPGRGRARSGGQLPACRGACGRPPCRPNPDPPRAGVSAEPLIPTTKPQPIERAKLGIERGHTAPFFAFEAVSIR